MQNGWKLGNKESKIRIFIITILLLFAFTISSCSTKSDCLTSDTIEQLKVFDEHDTKYSLFLRVSGLQEKESFYELYKGIPVFDNCGQPNFQAVSAIHIDKQQGTVSKLTIEGERLDPFYSSGDNSNTNFKDVNVEIRERKGILSDSTCSPQMPGVMPIDIREDDHEKNWNK